MREEKDGRSGQYKRMKRKGEEGVGRGRDRERKRTYERQEAPVGTPAEHLSLKRLLLSITVSSPRFFSSISFVWQKEGHPKGERAGA